MEDLLQGTGSLLFALIMHFVWAYPLYVIGQKTNSANSWFAFIPILNILLMLDIAGKDMWWVILFFIPCVNIVILVITWMGIAEAVSKPSWFGFLMLIPGVNLVVPWILAFG